MGKSSNQKTKTTAKPWAPQAEALKGVFGTAKDVYGAGSSPNADMQAAWAMTRDNINNPNSGYGKAKSYWDNVLATGGYDDNVFKNISSKIIPTVTSQFMGAGRSGSGLEGINLTDQLTQSFSPFAIGQANMAANALPSMEANATNALGTIGQQQFDYPWQNLGNYYGIIGGNNWGGTTINKTPGPSTGMTLAGGLLGGLGTAAKIYGGMGGA